MAWRATLITPVRGSRHAAFHPDAARGNIHNPEPRAILRYTGPNPFQGIVEATGGDHAFRAFAPTCVGWRTVKPRAGLILELFVNLVLPWVAYRVAHPYFGETGALYASAVPPIVWSIVEFIRSRRIDAVAAIVLLGITLSIVGMAFGGSPRTLLMRESIGSGTIGIVFLLSLLRERPLIYYLARATVAREMDGGAAHFEAVWDAQPGLRQMLRLMTFVWGAIMTLEMLLRWWMVANWPVERVLVVSPVMGYTVFGCLLLWTFWYRRRMRVRNSVDIPGRGGVTETAGR